MQIDEAIKMLKAEYEKALKQERIYNPLAYALHQVWKKADSKGSKVEKLCVNCKCCVKGYFPSKPNEYVCTGVREPFIIGNVFKECTERKHKKKKMTNFEKIKAMSVEDMALFLYTFNGAGFFGEAEIAMWLESEVVE